MTVCEGKDTRDCAHSFARFSIAMIGIRWQCVQCGLIAPECFSPVQSAIAHN